jgi:hypothetical protein
MITESHVVAASLLPFSRCFFAASRRRAAFVCDAGCDQPQYATKHADDPKSKETHALDALMAHDATGCDGMRRDATGCDGMRRDATGCDGMRRDATGCDGMRRGAKRGAAGIRTRDGKLLAVNRFGVTDQPANRKL